MRHLTTDATARLDVAGQALELIVNGTPDESGDVVWRLVEQAKRKWAIAGSLAERLEVSAPDVMSMMQVVDETVRDGRPVSWAVQQVDARSLNSHGAVTTEQALRMVAFALGLPLPPPPPELT
jgi:hypothetical protein